MKSRSFFIVACWIALWARENANSEEQRPRQAPIRVTDQLGAINADEPTMDELNEALLRTQEDLSELEARLQSGTLGVGGQYVPASDFMPPPADPASLFRDELTDRTNLGAGTRIPGTSLIFRPVVTGTAEVYYDTGFVGGGATFRPTTIALDGTTKAHRRGHFDLATKSSRLIFDLQVPLLAADTRFSPEQAQGYLETDIDGETLSVRHAYARIGNLLAGRYWTTWHDEGTVPRSIGTELRPAGTIFRQVPQIRLAIPHDSGWVSTFGIEKPLVGDFAKVTPSDTVLQRYPDFATRLRYFDRDRGFTSVAVGGLLRALGLEDAASGEDFAVGWGVSASARFRVTNRSAMMLGFVGGEGIAGSIWGLSPSTSAGGPSASPAAGGRLIPLTNYGGYIGYQQIWNESLQSTFAYGFAYAKGTPAMPALGARRTHNAWANLTYNVNENFAFGIEYTYGQLDAFGGSRGDDHRFLFVISLKGFEKIRQSRADLSDRDALFAPTSDTRVSRFSRL